MAKRKKQPYTYQRISELTHQTTSNFYGIVTKCSDPIIPSAQNSDQSMRMEVIDSPENKINVNIFFESHIDKLQPGTIIRFHRAKITKTYQSLLATGNLDNGIARFTMIWVNDQNQNNQNNQNNNNNYQNNNQNNNFINNLNNRQQINNAIPLGDLESCQGQFVGVLCKIISKSIVITSNQKKVQFCVWDGTGFGYEFFHNQTDVHLAHRLGVLMSVVAWDPQLIPSIDSLTANGPDQWALMNNVLIQRYQGTLEIKITKVSRVTLLDQNNDNVKRIIQLHHNRIDEYLRLTQKTDNNNNDEQQQNNNQDQMQVDSTNPNRILPIFTNTSTLHPSVPITLISDILKHDQKVPNKFKISCKLIQHIPMNIMEFTRFICRGCGQCPNDLPHFTLASPICPKCESTDIGSIYMFKLIVKDESGELPIIVYDNHAKQFFNGVEACDLYQHVDKLGLIEHKMVQLKQKCSPELGDTYFDCCIMSYYMQGYERTPENISYQLFDTKLN
ncbi:hypothetical protein DFA_00088 [Cavenderia fasciculata]|uniref:Telomeric single stranded DNA binding POT1/Cdc13 domain-containing protein n=1 Tax=Cavenderia fasciculata TaxID=261658 RepID=F4PXK0_CACFS|nr:uncharacterized protein DFA_00088 [Cavenderia fasciculata]EGG19510.1 hypothetical protein DFA_00088 [Cavenderia fasciculata]|eukprot:XP_004357804.1 hypothetical protein DFA_00088 [Cavenderia fasciculata]